MERLYWSHDAFNLGLVEVPSISQEIFSTAFAGEDVFAAPAGVVEEVSRRAWLDF
jgi:hypothetical protein